MFVKLDDAARNRKTPSFVIPAEAGIQKVYKMLQHWMPDRGPA
jgi:hypothetical protein